VLFSVESVSSMMINGSHLNLTSACDAYHYAISKSRSKNGNRERDIVHDFILHDCLGFTSLGFGEMRPNHVLKMGEIRQKLVDYVKRNSVRKRKDGASPEDEGVLDTDKTNNMTVKEFRRFLNSVLVEVSYASVFDK